MSERLDTSIDRQPDRTAPGSPMEWVSYSNDTLGVFSLCAHAIEKLPDEHRGRVLRALAIIFEGEATP